MFIIDANTLQAIDLLNLINNIFCEFLDPEHPQNIVRINRTIDQRLTNSNNVALMNNQIFTLGNQLLNRITDFRSENNPLLAFNHFTQRNYAFDLSNNRNLFRFTGLKKLCNPRQTTSDILSFCGITRFGSNNITGQNLFPLGHHNMNPGRKIVTRIATTNLQSPVFLIFNRNSGS